MKHEMKKDGMMKGTKISSEKAKKMLETKSDRMTNAEKSFLGVISNPTGKRIDQQPSEKIPPLKAREILVEGTAHGKPLTKAQKGMFGAAYGSYKQNLKKK